MGGGGQGPGLGLSEDDDAGGPHVEAVDDVRVAAQPADEAVHERARHEPARPAWRCMLGWAGGCGGMRRGAYS